MRKNYQNKCSKLRNVKSFFIILYKLFVYMKNNVGRYIPIYLLNTFLYPLKIDFPNSNFKVVFGDA